MGDAGPEIMNGLGAFLVCDASLGQRVRRHSHLLLNLNQLSLHYSAFGLPCLYGPG